MYSNYRRLQAVLRMITPETFYVISIRDHQVDLQGHFSTAVVKALIKIKFVDAGLCEINRYVQLRRGNILITLT